jgi:hypothetical protein
VPLGRENRSCPSLTHERSELPHKALSAGVDFAPIKVDSTPVLQLKILLPRFPLSHEDGENDAQLLARVEQEARNIVGSYTRVEHEACIANLPNNGRLNYVLEVVGVSYGPRLVPVSTKVLKKKKTYAAAKVLGKCPKLIEKKGDTPAKVSGSRASAGLKQPLGTDILPAKSVSYPGSKKHRTEASIRVPRMFNHTHSNNMINRLNVSIKQSNIPYIMTRGSKKRLHSRKQRN